MKRFNFNIILFLAILLLTGCAARIKSSADREVYKILERKTKQITSEEISWDIESLKMQETPSEDTPLSLEDVLIIASRNNRDYQTAKEDVYLEALALTTQRHQFSLQYGVSGEGIWQKDGDEESVDANLNLNLVKWLSHGTQITVNIIESYLQYLMGSKAEAFQSVISLDILQPLFRGAGRSVAQADLIQAERDVIYEIRSFLRYQRDFSVTVAENYFDILQAKSNLENYNKNYLFLKETRGRVEMLAEAGRIPSFEADQAKQDEFRAHQRWIEANNSYKELLDEFKLFLGFAPEVQISLEEEGLESFLKKGIPQIKVDQQESINLALEKRLDLMTSRDQLEDSKRDAVVALNALKTKLDLNVGIDSSSPESSPPDFDIDEPSYTVGLDFELPVNKVPERNAYRQALISLERQKRTVALEEDEVKLEIMNLYRNLEEAYQTYLIQKASLELADKRVDSTDLLLQADRATTRDLLEAQEAYLNAKNSLAGAIVDYLIVYLEFLRDTELLELDNKGVWKGDLYGKISGRS